jgi:hypothetical protein
VRIHAPSVGTWQICSTSTSEVNQQSQQFQGESTIAFDGAFGGCAIAVSEHRAALGA